MAPVLPSSLSPHICILLLASSSLPPLPQLFQSFSPLPNVTTRSTSLTSIPHSSFSLRFSDLREIEVASREDEDQRAVRMLDWIGDRVNKDCAKWVHDFERTPWWDDLKRCAEGEYVPSKTEGWNHPVAVILAVSTTSPNPLQAITALHSRALDFPLWNSPLSDEEAGALFNAVKKQFGLHSYLLPLKLPLPSPPPVPVPFLLPRLPSPAPESSTNVNRNLASASNSNINTLRLSEGDIQQTGKFTREFVVMSLVPWMEKCVLEWNENFSSTRRLPSRLFSSTRRLFGSPSPSPVLTHTASSSVASLSSRSSVSSSAGQVGVNMPPPSQQRRLAEFATILGDYKLAITVWEALRKDGKGGADILPILLSPSTAIPSYVSNALSIIHPPASELSPKALLRGLIYAARWEGGIPTSEFLGDILGGERWLVWAAGDAEELPSALLVAHAAFLCARKSSKRRAAFWYLIAANKLEKLGIKPLTIHFLRRAHELYRAKPTKLLSPSFWDAFDQSSRETSGFDAVLAGIEHPLGRLLYTTGDIAEAVKLFIGLLRGPTSPYALPTISTDSQQDIAPDKLFLEDFKTAFSHLKSTITDESLLDQLQLPIKICQPQHTRLRFKDDTIWQTREDAWQSFRKSRGGKERLEKSGKAMVGETFWIDLVVENPLSADINLSHFTVIVREDTETPASEPLADVDVLEVTLTAKEKKTVSISITPLGSAPLVISHAIYNFLSLLPSSESLSYRGRRLHSAVKPTYGPDIHLKVAVVDADYRLAVNFIEDEVSLLHGEFKDMRVLLSNTGTKPISEIWIVSDVGDEIWLSEPRDDHDKDVSESEIVHSANSLVSDVVYRVPGVATEDLPLLPGDSKEVTIKLCAEGPGRKDLSLLLPYRGGNDMTFQSVRLHADTNHKPLFIHPSRRALLVNASPWGSTHGVQETLDYVSTAFGDIVGGRDIQKQNLPSIGLAMQAYSEVPMIHHFVEHRRQQIVSQNIVQSIPHLPPRLHSSVFPLYNPFSVDVLHRLTLGARHAAMSEVIENSENTKIKTNRSMYAETQREKAEILGSMRSSEWNAEMDPLFVAIQGQSIFMHDFSQGPYIAQLSITLRNHSLTYPTEFVLKFPMVQKHSSNLAPTYMGRTTFRGSLEPSQSTTIKPKVCITQPGVYAIDGWNLTTEVFRSSDSGKIPFRRYNRQPSPEETTRLTICDIQTA
ncbi:ER-golgi trafficking TRAPP I complex 85 kDa subunit-domain-containing protein [Amanita rubescens]|nr:ER-golgi trafficking TRAPP I complex 85 kDa subunit-domain-containing protein [Amanita rubescens]